MSGRKPSGICWSICRGKSNFFINEARKLETRTNSTMSRLCTYLITSDTGLAPNPYWGYCTLSVCTPNHMGARLGRGDWISGFLCKRQDYRLVYAMEISERLQLDDYFRDPRFAAKIPKLNGDWKQRCGDNFYSQAPDGTWRKHRNCYHIAPYYLQKDTQHPYVFIATKFWYFGSTARPRPIEFASLVGGRGIRVNHDE